MLLSQLATPMIIMITLSFFSSLSKADPQPSLYDLLYDRSPPTLFEANYEDSSSVKLNLKLHLQSNPNSNHHHHHDSGTFFVCSFSPYFLSLSIWIELIGSDRIESESESELYRLEGRKEKEAIDV
jgi:hypothetical protein